MFEAALNYPRNSDSALKNVAIGGMLIFASFLFVPTFFVLGYVVRALRNIMNGVEEPPAFDGWGELFVDGLKTFAIGFVYSLVPAVFVLVTLFASGASLGLSGSGNGGSIVAVLLALVAVLATVVVSLLLAYLLPAAIVSWVRTDSLSAAFSPGELRVLAFSRTYATGWAVAFGIGLLAGIVSGILSSVLIGGLLVPFVTFYANVAGVHAIGSAVGEMPAVGAGPDAPASQPAA